MPRTTTVKSWVFTWNNYPPTWKQDIEEAVETLLEEKGITAVYWSCGQEVGESGTPHIQGFIAFDKALSQPSRHLWQAHWEAARRPQKAILYTQKGEQSHAEWLAQGASGPNFGVNAEVWEHGAKPQKHGVQGKRTDLHALRDAIEQAFEAGETYTERDARSDFPDTAARYPLFVKQSIKDFKPPPEVEAFPLRTWQQELNQKLNHAANSREVIFVVDEVGNSGKTWFSKYYRSLHENVQLVPPGKYADMAYLVDENTRVFFIDTPREKVEYFNYYFLEKLKDRDVFSSKYYPEHKEFRDNVHVVVLMNTMPDMNKLSADRYTIINTAHFT